MQEDDALKQKAAQKFIYKIHTKQLKRSNWNLNMPLETAIREYPDLIVSINDSQMLRWIDELNGVTDYSERTRTIRNRIQYIKNKPKSRQQKQALISSGRGKRNAVRGQKKQDDIPEPAEK